ncbi:MAG: putative DNA modification/repair radical SAM protein [Oscillospiraceae bacterium]|nr:putative DNA modification/repair radical SAM protein [Oscillospiraceae bacterium]
MDMYEKLTILTDAAKYDVACTSSGISRGSRGGLGTAVAAGICHSWSADGRCISLLKVLFTNYCRYDCAFCINRKSNDVPRAAFTPRELADLTIEFYRRNYIEGLFISSGVLKNADYTMEQMIKCVRILRQEYGFNGYIHAKAIPGASRQLVEIMGSLVDRVSVNIELPSEASLKKLAPQKSKANILTPMKTIADGQAQAKYEMVKYRHAPRFAPAGQSTQMIIGASEESDFHILRLSQALYDKYKLKRVFFSAYIPLNDDRLLPAKDTKPPLLREHRLYQADWLLRFYGFRAEEILSEQDSMFNPLLDPKCNWALNNMHLFPVEVNTAPYEMLLRVPGIGVTGARRIVAARKMAWLDFDRLKKMGIVLKRAQYFIICKGKAAQYVTIDKEKAAQMLISTSAKDNFNITAGDVTQLSFFDTDRLNEKYITAKAERMVVNV